MRDDIIQILETVDASKKKTINLLGLIAKITSPFFLAFFIAKWFYIVQGIEYDPLEKLEDQAIKFFKKKPLFKVGGEK